MTDLSPAAQIEIKHRYTGAVLRAVQADTLSRANLRDANLRGADLRGAALRYAVFRDADLRDADLRDADLTGAYLRGAVLRGADLTGADLAGAYLRGAYLRYAVLRDADLRDADLRGANLWDADLTGAYLRGARIADYVVTTVVAQLQRSDGHVVLAYATDSGEIIVCAGCWSGTLAEARAYKAGADYARADENSVICDFIAVRARQLGLVASAALGDEADE